MNNKKDAVLDKQALVNRLRDRSDQESWRMFFDSYRRLIYHASIRAGLNDAEAQDVIQDTMCSVSKSIPSYRNGASHCSFNTWLLRLTTWRIKDQLRKRQRCVVPLEEVEKDGQEGSGFVDSGTYLFEEAWDREWEAHTFQDAASRVKQQADPRQYRMFQLYVLRKWSALRVARAFKTSRGRVYLAKHRISKMMREEIRMMESERAGG